MPNAADIKQADLAHNILLLGYTGSGKTAQILTLPGKTFVYILDPSALHTLAGHDLDYELFMPSKLNLAAQSLGKDKTTKLPKSDKPTKYKDDSGNIYLDFAEHLTEGVESGFFNQFDNVVVDSLTTFSDIVMDRVLELNGRKGQFPQQDDYPAQMVTIKSVLRELTGLDVRLLCTGHVEFKQDEDGGGKMMNVIRLTGQLRTTIPILFSDILYCDLKSVPGADSQYIFKTVKDRHNPQVRCTLRDSKGKRLPEEVVVDIPDSLWKDPRGACGLGGLILNASEDTK